MMKRFLFIIGVFFFFSLLAVLWYFHLIPQKYYFNEDFGIIDYHSNSDADQDGIDDRNLNIRVNIIKMDIPMMNMEFVQM